MPGRRVTPPDAPPTPIETRGESLGIHYSRGRTITSNSHLALEAAEFALEYGDPWRFHHRLFKAYFDDLEDIGQVDRVVRAGAEAGLDEKSLRAALEERRYRERVDEGIAWSRSIGVTAIPTFVVNDQYAVVGAQPLEVFRSVMEQLGETRRGPA